MVVALAAVILLLFVMVVPLAHADRFSEWLDAYHKGEITDIQIKKAGQEHEAIKYQKKVLNFDYDKIQNGDGGFKAPDNTWKPKKTIDRIVFLR